MENENWLLSSIKEMAMCSDPSELASCVSRVRGLGFSGIKFTTEENKILKAVRDGVLSRLCVDMHYIEEIINERIAGELGDVAQTLLKSFPEATITEVKNV